MTFAEIHLPWYICFITSHGPNANHPHDRRFFVHCTYGGCDADWGWFVILDMDHSKVCHWEIEVGANPIFLFSGEKVQSATVGESFNIIVLSGILLWYSLQCGTKSNRNSIDSDPHWQRTSISSHVPHRAKV